jgi:hypothetical protein
MQHEVKERLELYILRTDRVVIRPELIYSFAVKVEGTVKWNFVGGTTQPKNSWFTSGPGNNPEKT